MTTKQVLRCRAYYQRVKQDSNRHAALKARRTENQRRRRAAAKTAIAPGHVKQPDRIVANELLLELMEVCP